MKDKKKTPNKKQKEGIKQWWESRDPNWVMALATVGMTAASFLLVLVTGFYTYYAWNQVKLTREGLIQTKEALDKNTEQFSKTLGEMKVQTDAAWSAAGSAKRSANAAERQFGVVKEQSRLDQRAWVGYYRYEIRSRKNEKSGWENRKPKAREQYRVLFYIRNTGKTPALNVRLMHIEPMVIPSGTLPKEPEWGSYDSRFPLFPSDDGFSHLSRPRVLEDKESTEYDSDAKELFFWTKLYYCDVSGKLHWTKAGVVLPSGISSGFSIRQGSVGTKPSGGVHPDCQ